MSKWSLALASIGMMIIAMSPMSDDSNTILINGLIITFVGFIGVIYNKKRG